MIRRAAVVLTIMLTSAPAFADCDSAARYNFVFANQAAATLAYGTTYSYTATTSGGASRGFTMAMTQNGLTSTSVNGSQLPAISTLITGTDAAKRDLVLGGTFSGRTSDVAGGTRVVAITFTFAQPVRDFAVTLHDVDFTANQYRDIVMISGTSAAGSYVPALVTPFGNGNGALPRTAGGSSITVGSATSPVTITTSQAVGSGASANNSDTGTLSATFIQPVTSVTVRYANAPLTTGESTTGQQAMGIEGLNFCPMPNVSIVKSSTPVADINGAYNLPGSDVIYALTVTNTGASPVDAATIVLTDMLPNGVTFRNLAYDGTTSLPVSVSGGAGVTLATGGIAYAPTGSSVFNLSPTTGYDVLVRGVRITPTGQLPANASFIVRFRARIE